MTHAQVLFRLLAALLPVAAISPGHAQVQDSFCASVRVEVHQEFTLARQGFEATMRLTNELPDSPLTDVHIEITFKDSSGNTVTATQDPNGQDALFFYRLQFHEGLTSVDGSGAIAADSEAELRWLIVPTADAAGNSPNGSPYLIGAEVSYRVNGAENTIPVAPDFIQVKPVPRLSLDYFIPEQVFGDDPFTQSVEEEPIPFELGLRVANTGLATAYALQIDSAQPEITENKQGLLVDFQLLGARLGDAPATPSLFLNLGDVESQAAIVAAWTMTTSLTGQFKRFTTDIRHAEELGGQLTSLIESPRTHKLVHRVQVDLPGRDEISDFLAKESLGDLRVYESDGTEFPVTDVSENSQLTVGSTDPLQQTVQLQLVGGLVYAQIPDLNEGAKTLVGVTRSDGKVLSARNAWLSKRQDDTTHEYTYFVNIFDSVVEGQPTGEYLLSFANPIASEATPELDVPNTIDAVDGVSLSFVVSAFVGDGSIPSLAMESAPETAQFSDAGDGTGVFDWPVPPGRLGDFTVIFSAVSRNERAEGQTLIRVRRPGDSDADYMDDSWEMAHFGSLEQDGSGDWDGDGISDLDEYLNQTDPTTADDPWSVIRIGSLEVGDQPVAVPGATANDVVLLGPPSDLTADPGLAVISVVDETQMGVRIREWNYLDGVAPNQAISYLVLPVGRYSLADGTVWEAGYFDLEGDRNWQPQSFKLDFPEEPTVYLSSQPSAGPLASLRTRAISRSGFETAQFVEEAQRGSTIPQSRIHYLAIWSPGTAASLVSANAEFAFSSQQLDLALQQRDLDWDLTQREEISADEETDHVGETVQLLKIGQYAFAQIASDREDDPLILYATLADRDQDSMADAFERRYGLDPQDPTDAGQDLDGDGYSNLAEYLANTNPADASSLPDQLRLKFGQVQAGQSWREVTWAQTNEQTVPLVFLGPATNNDPYPGIATLSDTTANGFAYRYRNLHTREGEHGEETLSYLAMVPGRYSMPDGAVWEAGSFDLPLAETWYQLDYLSAFPQTPALYLSVQSPDYGGIARARSVELNTFEIIINRLEPDAPLENIHVAYLAVYHPTGAGTLELSGNTINYQTMTQDTNHRVSDVGGTPLRLEMPASVTGNIEHGIERIAVLDLHSEQGTVWLAQDTSASDTAPAVPRIWSIVDGDNDGIPDLQELRYGANPRNASDAAQDSDHDGFRNFAEILFGTDPFDANDSPGPNDALQTIPENPEDWWNERPTNPGVVNQSGNDNAAQ